METTTQNVHAHGSQLKLTRTREELEARGYEYWEAYANNYPCCHKETPEFDIWCWLTYHCEVDGKGYEAHVEVKDWHSWTEKILKFYKENQDKLTYFEHKLIGKSVYLNLLFNYRTGEILLRDEERKKFDDYEKFMEWKYANEYDDKPLGKDITDKLIKEIEWLTT